MRHFLSQEYKRHAQATIEQISAAGISVMLVLLCVGAFFHMLVHDAFGIDPMIFGIGVLIGVLAQFFPRLLRFPYILWMMFAAVLGWVNTRVILGIIFFGMFTPVALFFRMIGKDPLARKFSAKETYRETVPTEEEGSTMKDPF